MKLNFCVFAIATFSGASIKCISAEDVSHLVSCEEESRSGQMTCYDGEAGCIFLIVLNLLRNLSQLLSPVHDWKCEHAAISNFCKRYRENPQIEEGSATEPSRIQDRSVFDKQVKDTKGGNVKIRKIRKVRKV
jgi:hypothetical protein